MELSNSNTRITFLLCAMHQRISVRSVEYSSQIARPAKKVQPRRAREPAEFRQQFLLKFNDLKNSVEAPSRPWPEFRLSSLCGPANKTHIGPIIHAIVGDGVAGKLGS
jgi:hypothetical protein